MGKPAKVAKFGGVCVSRPDMYDRIAKLLQEDSTRRFLVVSAIAGVTDSLFTTIAKPRE